MIPIVDSMDSMDTIGLDLSDPSTLKLSTGFFLKKASIDHSLQQQKTNGLELDVLAQTSSILLENPCIPAI